MASITFEHVTKIYPDGTEAVSDVSLQVEDGQLLVLLGPSGCGKTTLLRMVAGLEDVTEGAIRIGDRVVNDVQPKDRDIAMVFQNYALYPHMDVASNMAFGLKLRGIPKRRVSELVGAAAQQLELTGLLHKKPRELSGGQRQRVAMGRAIVREPKAFLMDEPLSNLDAKLRTQVRTEIARLQRRLRTTTIYVTHDQTEAMTLGHLVAVMRSGVIQQLASPHEIYRRPANLFVAGFIGAPAMNIARGTIRRSGEATFVELGGKTLSLEPTVLVERPDLARYEGRAVAIGVRPEHLADADLRPDVSSDCCFEPEIDIREEMGAETYVHFAIDASPVVTADILELAEDTDAELVERIEEDRGRGQTRFVARLDAATQVRPGQRARIAVDTSNMHFFDLDTGMSIYAGSLDSQQPV